MKTTTRTAKRSDGKGKPRRGAAALPDSGYRPIWDVVARIPEGRVATYGQVAALAGRPGHARQVGYALHSLPDDSNLPWHRVINARGEVSLRSEPGWVEGWQRHLLEEEGVTFDARGRVDLARFGWDPDERPGRRDARSSDTAARRPGGRAATTAAPGGSEAAAPAHRAPGRTARTPRRGR